MAASPDHPTDATGAVVGIALRVGATAVAHADVPAMLSGVCAALPSAVGVAGAVLLLTEPADPRDPRAEQMFASDDVANRLGLIQHRAGRGPIPAAVRSDRPLTVPNLTLAGPPELAAAAADCGLVRSLVVPIPVGGRPGGGLQLLAAADGELDDRLVGVLWPLVTALSARLTDARELARRPPPAPVPVPGADPHPTAAVTITRREQTVSRPEQNGSRPEPAGPGPEPAGPMAVPVAATTRVPVVAPEPGAVPRPEPEDAGARPEPVAADPVAVRAPTRPDPGLTLRMPATGTDPDGPVVITERDPLTDLFAAGETAPDTPPAGQTELGWDDLEHPPSLPRVPVRSLPARVRAVGRARRPLPRPVPAAVPAQRSGPLPTVPGPSQEIVPPLPAPAREIAPPPPGPPPEQEVVPATPGPPPVDGPVDSPVDGGLDGPTWRVPRHRLRD